MQPPKPSELPSELPTLSPQGWTHEPQLPTSPTSTTLTDAKANTFEGLIVNITNWAHTHKPTPKPHSPPAAANTQPAHPRDMPPHLKIDSPSDLASTAPFVHPPICLNTTSIAMAYCLTARATSTPTYFGPPATPITLAPW